MKTHLPIGAKAVDLGDDLQWFRSSPLILLKSLGVVVAAVVLFFIHLLQSGMSLSEMADVWHFIQSQSDNIVQSFVQMFHAFGGVVLIVIVVLLVIIVASFLSWKNTFYAVDDTTFHVKKGIISKHHRRVPINRIQNVSVNQSLLRRALGYATVTIESAGSTRSHVIIDFIAKDYASNLHDILTRTSIEGAGLGTADAQVAGGMAPVNLTWEKQPTEVFHPVYEVKIKDLVMSLILDVGHIVLAIIIVLSIIAAIVTIVVTGASWGTVASVVVAGMGGFIAIVVMFVTLAGRFWKLFADYYQFRAVVDNTTIRISRGLISTKNQTIPRHRIHAVRIEQNILWRSRQMWRVKVLLAGTSAMDNNEGDKSAVMLPVGTYQQVVGVLTMVLSDFDIDDPRPLIDNALGTWHTTRNDLEPQIVSQVTDNVRVHGIGRKARWLHPWAKDYMGVLLGTQYMMERRGRFHRNLSFIPYSHIQGFSLSQGPLDRMMKVGKIHVHLVGTSATVQGYGQRIVHQSLPFLSFYITHQGELIRHNWTALRDSIEAREAVDSLEQNEAETLTHLANNNSDHNVSLL